MSAGRLAVILLAGLTLIGCSASMGAPKASLASLETLRSWDAPAMRAGAFALAPGLPPAIDRSVGIRGTILSSPEGGFARHLRGTLEAQLRAAGKYDDGSNIVIEGLLTRSNTSAGVSDGRATLGARFSATRDGRTVFDKELSVDAVWDSTFVGVEAIPDAINHYTALYERLVRQLLEDEDFKRAVGSGTELQ